MAKMELTLTFAASMWHGGRDRQERLWSAPTHKNGDNAAARIESRSRWPFKKWIWAVWSPFNNDSAMTGECATPEAAMLAADEALRSLIESAMRVPDPTGLRAMAEGLAADRLVEDAEAGGETTVTPPAA